MVCSCAMIKDLRRRSWFIAEVNINRMTLARADLSFVGTKCKPLLAIGFNHKFQFFSRKGLAKSRRFFLQASHSYPTLLV